MQHLSKRLLFLLLILPQFGYSQIVADNFSDSNFTADPIWTGDIGAFIVNDDKELQSNGPSATATLHLVTPNTSFENVSWSIWVNLNFSPSRSNYSRIYLMSDQANLEGDLNGYYIELGESGSEDAVELYRQEGGRTTEIFSLNDAAIATAFTLRLKVTRDNAGLWTIFVDMTGGNTFVELGSVTDNTIQVTSYFGMLIQHSSTRKNLFYYDNVLIENLPDTTPPVISNINVIDANNIGILFDEDVNQATAETITNYTVDNAIGQPIIALRDVINNNKVTLTFSTAFTDQLHNSIEVINVKDLSDNAIPSRTPASANFIYFGLDLTPPVLTGVTVVALNQIFVEFDEVIEQGTAETMTNYSIDNGINLPNAAQRDSIDQNKVLLTFDHEFTIGSDYIVSVRNIADADRNVIVGTLTANFTLTDIFPPVISQLIVIAANALDLYFDESVDETTSQNVSNYAKNKGKTRPVIAIRDAINLNVVHLFFPDNFSENTDITLSITNLADTTGNSLVGNLDVIFQYDTDKPAVCTTCVVPVSSNELDIAFSEKIDLTTSQIINHYEVNSEIEGHADIGFPISATRDATESTVRLMFANDFEQEVSYKTRVTKVRDLSGNIMTTRNRSFIYDTKPPAVTKLRVLSNDTLQLTFSEIVETVSAELITNYTVDNTIGNPTSALVFEGNMTIVKLYFASGLGNTNTLTLSVQNMADLLDNMMAEAQNINFTTLAPTIAKVTVISKTQIQVLFSEDTELTSAQTNTNYLVNKNIGNPTVATQHSNNAALIVLDFTNKLVADTIYTITLNNIEDLTAHTSSELTENLVYDNQIVSVTAVSNNLVEVVLENTPNESEAEDVSKYSVNNGIGNPLSAIRIITINRDDTTRMVQLAFSNVADQTNYEFTLGSIALENGSTIPISTHSFILDKTPPYVAKAEIVDDNTLYIYFSEDVDKIIAEALNHYAVDNGIGTPSEVVLNSSNDSVAVLAFSSNFAFETNYSLTITNIKDLNGLELISEQVDVHRPTAPNLGEIVITEIFADPFPVVGLPEEEFLELYNNSEQTINLVGLQISDPTVTATLSSYELAAKAYLIVVPNGSAQLFEEFGDVLEINDFPNLNSDDENLTLTAADGDLIYNITYDKDWYQDNIKENGGYSLEIINPTLFACHSKSNWIASTDPACGTPGQVNSVNDIFHDQDAPQILNIEVTQPNKLALTFNEELDSLMMVDHANYSINNGVAVLTANYINKSAVLLTLDIALDENILYQITIQNIRDCAENQSEEIRSFGIGATPQTNELVITEIFADENPQVGLPLVEYIEVFNRSSRLLNLKGLILRDATDKAPLENTLMPPRTYLVLSKTTAINSFSRVAVLGVSNFPSLNNTGELLTIENENGTIINSVNYNDNWYKDNEKNGGGYSLEIIDTDNVCNGIENWVVSKDPAGGTPGLVNSVDADNPDVVKPSILGIEIITANEIQVSFSKKMNVSTVFIDASNYVIDNGLNITEVIQIDDLSVRVLFNSALTFGITYTLAVSNITDCAGNQLEINKYTFEERTNPTVVKISIINSFKIEVVFSEPMNSNAAITNVENYSISTALKIIAINIINETTIEITFASEIAIGETIELSISNITDKVGSPLETIPIAFGIGEAVRFHDIVISEIHAFPSSENDLPEVEFIELFNRTDHLISLENIRLNDAKNELKIPRSTEDLPMVVILPREYLILTASANSYRQFGKVVEIVDWKSDQLEKSGESLILTNNIGELIFEIQYDEEWYQNIDATYFGGVTLEMIDTNNPCGESNNWRASENENGGTPGKANSITGTLSDTTPPKLIKAEASDTNTLRLTFNEKLMGSSASLALYTVDNGITATFKKFIIPNTDKVYLELNPALKAGVTYTVIVNGLQDCLNNTMGNNSFKFKLPEIATETDILINEILFNPQNNGSDFVELYNNSEKYINLQGWQIANKTSKEVIIDDVLVLAPQQYIVLTEDIKVIKNTFTNGVDSTYFKTNLPTYNSSDGSVLLYDNSQEPQLMQQFDYNEDFHFALLDDVKGVSLERITFNAEANDKNNWKSASSFVGFGTPGYLNSQNINNPLLDIKDCFRLSSEIFTLNESGLDNFVTIEYACDDILDVVNITIFNLKGVAVKHFSQSQTLSTNGTLPPWDGVDDSGNKVRVGYYIIFIETFDLDGNVKKVKKTVAVGN